MFEHGYPLEMEKQNLLAIIQSLLVTSVSHIAIMVRRLLEQNDNLRRYGNDKV